MIVKDKLFPILLIIIGLFTVGIVTFFNVTGKKMQKEIELTKKSVMAITVFCQEGAKDEVVRWGKTGYSRSCLVNGVKDGKWVAWEKQQIAIEGYYRNDKKHGQWIWYNQDRSIYKKVEFNNGIEVRGK